MKPKVIFSALLIFLVFTTAFTSLAKERVKVGWIPAIGFAPLLVGIEKGYFREAGVEVSLEPLTGGGDVLAMVATGHLDVGGAALGASAFNGFKSGMDFLVVAPFFSDSPPLNSALIIRKSSMEKGEIRSIRDLRGKKVAINAIGVSTEYGLAAALRKGGLSLRDIDLVTMPFPLMTQALANGQIDGALDVEPFVTMAVKKFQAVRLSDDHIDFYEAVVLFYGKSFATKRRRAANGFMLAYLKGARDLYNKGWKTQEHLRFIEKYTKLPAAIAKDANMPFVHPNGELDISDLMRQQEFYMERGYLKYDKPINVNDIIDRSFVKNALSILGIITKVDRSRR